MEAKSVAKNIRISPQKARLVADLIRGNNVESAITTLRFMPKKAARIIRKLIESAVANANQNEAIDVDTLYIKKVYVGYESPAGVNWPMILQSMISAWWLRKLSRNGHHLLWKPGFQRTKDESTRALR